MARYLETGTNFGKAEIIAARFNALEIRDTEARFLLEHEPNAAIIVVVENLHFEAAAFADTLEEYQRFMDNPRDNRPKTILLAADRQLVEQWAGKPQAYMPEVEAV